MSLGPLYFRSSCVEVSCRTKWLSSKGYEFRHAVDGLAGVSAYNEEGPFEYATSMLSDFELTAFSVSFSWTCPCPYLMVSTKSRVSVRKLSLYRSLGVSAAAMIRKFERERQEGRRVRILALTGMSSLEDKRRAFAAGVDG